MFNSELFKTDPRSFALELVENGAVSADHLLLCALKYMSHDDCRDMLDCNELSPRFDDDADDDADDDFEFDDEETTRAAFWDENPEFSDSQYSADGDHLEQNEYSAEIRTAFVDWLDSAHRAGRIGDELAGDVTLGSE